MKNHILDRVEYYTDAGYDENTAVEKTLQYMGDAETVGTEIGKVHKSVLSSQKRLQNQQRRLSIIREKTFDRKSKVFCSYFVLFPSLHLIAFSVLV